MSDENNKPVVKRVVEPVPYETFQRICSDLEQFHGVFSTLARYGRFVFDNVVPTAAVMFNKDGDLIRFVFNKDFWNELDHYNRLFVICHECMHIISNHGVRLQSMKAVGIGPNGPISIGNIATDITINELLVDQFDFSRFKLEIDGCFIDTVFRDKKYKGNVKRNECAEYYYNLLVEGSTKIDINNFDDHSGLGDMDEKTKEQIKKLLENNLSPEEKESFLKRVKSNDKEFEKAKEEKDEKKDKESTDKQAGTIAGHIEKMVEKARYKPKKKWENIIRVWIRNKLGGTQVEDSWLFENRRMHMLESDVMVPGERNDAVFKDKRKLNMFLSLDTSGSCSHLSQRFFNLCNTIPRHRFEIFPTCFDTNLYEINLKDQKLYGFGGTSFQCISNYVYGKKHDTVFDICVILTDGYGDMPNIPEDQRHKWYWLLTEDYRHCIPEGCKIFDLNKFE